MPYNKKYLQELPPVGVQCPNEGCDGFIESGKYEGSVICRSCKTAFYKSKFPPKKMSPKQTEATGQVIIMDEIMGALRKLWEKTEKDKLELKKDIKRIIDFLQGQ